MARPREFDVTAALDLALGVFWAKGFDGCSIQDLLDAMQINRQSLYNTFGDKDALFLRVLERYQLHLTTELAPLRDKSAGLQTFYLFVREAIVAQQRQGAGACLMVMTAFSPKFDDAKLAQVITLGSQSLRDCLSQFIANSQERGEISRSADATVTANYLYTLLNGSSALSRTGVHQEEVLKSLRLALRTLSERPVLS